MQQSLASMIHDRPPQPDRDNSFGVLLRTHRRRAGLTQQALAELSTISSRAIRDLESGRAAARAQTIRLLADGLGLDGLSRETFLDAGNTRNDGPQQPALGAAPPYPTGALHGREADVRSIVHALEARRRRAYTLLGLGGVGKTQVVLEVVRRLYSQRGWPVVWVPAGDLATGGTNPLTDDFRAVLDADAVASARLRRLIGRHDVLVVLDGVPALPPAANEHLRELLIRCPGLRLIATTRGQRHLRDTQPTTLGPLPTPDRVNGSLPALAGVPSVQLLTERISDAQPGWVLSRAEADTVARLCRRLDGLPLALEIAAYQSVVFTLQELASLPMQDLLDLPTPMAGRRPTTIRRLLDDSIEQLDQPAVRDLKALAQLDHSWTIADATSAFGRTRAEIIETLATLTRAGMIRRNSEAGTTRFELLHLVRGYYRRDDEPE